MMNKSAANSKQQTGPNIRGVIAGFRQPAAKLVRSAENVDFGQAALAYRMGTVSLTDFRAALVLETDWSPVARKLHLVYSVVAPVPCGCRRCVWEDKP